MDSHLFDSACEDVSSSIIEKRQDTIFAENDFTLAPEEEEFLWAKNGLTLEPETGEVFSLAEDDIIFDLEGPIMIASSKEGRKKKPPKPRKPRLVPTYELDPRTGKWTELKDAYPEDGTPLRPKNCPDGKKRTCCRFDAVAGPYSDCWKDGYNNAVCRYAKNQFCCEDVPVNGGPGVNCEEAKWVKDRGRKARPEDSEATNQFQEVFPILRELPLGFPDLNPNLNLNPNPNPAYCRPGERERERD